jgi:uncharacterized protein (TIGR03086 family)
MTETTDAPFFPAPVLAPLADPGTARELLAATLRDLAGVVDAPGRRPDAATPCTRYTLDELRDHVLGWLQFFTAAFADPAAAADRPDPERFRAAADPSAAAAGGCRRIVEEAAATFDRALAGGVLAGRVRLSQSFMDGPAALGMVLGEYLVHGWDLATAQGLPWDPTPRACAVARDFFEGTIAPQYRGGDGGFFDAEVAVPADASDRDRLLGFAGRDPQWTPPAA